MAVYLMKNKSRASQVLTQNFISKLQNIMLKMS